MDSTTLLNIALKVQGIAPALDGAGTTMLNRVDTNV